VTRLLQQLTHRCRAERLPLRGQFASQSSRALARPPQGGLRIALAVRFRQCLQGVQQPRLRLIGPHPPVPWTPLAIRRQRVTRVESAEDASPDRDAGQSRGLGHGHNSTASQRNRLHRPSNVCALCRPAPQPCYDTLHESIPQFVNPPCLL
jgi:hypothetical protein